MSDGAFYRWNALRTVSLTDRLKEIPLSSSVADDAVLDQTIQTTFTVAIMSSGQACAAGTRLLMPRKHLDETKRNCGKQLQKARHVASQIRAGAS